MGHGCVRPNLLAARPWTGAAGAKTAAEAWDSGEALMVVVQEKAEAEAEAITSADDGLREVVVLTMGGEAVLPRGPWAADTTVGELLQRCWQRGGPPGLLRLVHGSRQLAAHQRLRDLEVDDPEQGLALTLVRQAAAAGGEVIARIRSDVHFGVLSLRLRSDVGDAEVAAIAHLLQDPECAIEALDMSFTKVADIAPLAEALQLNSTLQELQLRQTRVEDIGALAEALQANRSLKLIDLGYSQVREVGDLPAALRANWALSCLSLSGCPLPDDTQELLRAVGREKAAEGSAFRLVL